MWWFIGSLSLVLAMIGGYFHSRNGQREWQILKRNAQQDHLKKGRWRRALTLRLFGHK